ncbi:hypothetical protein D3C80_2147530 [compost metagenome]
MLAESFDIGVTPVFERKKNGLNAAAKWGEAIFHFGRNLRIDLALNQAIFFQLT